MASLVESPLWTHHYESELEECSRIPPLNGFMDMEQMTRAGQLWHFPVDNEQGVPRDLLDEPFHAHVFLDEHLERFPDIEPIQQFMALVLNGISRNAFLTLADKHEIIDWYVAYFADKADVIRDALEAEQREIERIAEEERKHQHNK